MATLQIENLPDDLFNRIRSLAIEKQITVNDAVVELLNQAFQTFPNSLEKSQMLASREALGRIRGRQRVNPAELGFPDSTELIRDDRNR